MILTCAIIDDEPWAVRLLEAYVKKVGNLDLVATFSSAVEAVKGLEDTTVDLIFCDIQMPELDGLRFAQMMGDSPSRIVFTTAFDKYALEGWKVEALDYLLKPIAYADFLFAVQKAERWFSHRHPALPLATDSIFVKTDYKLMRVRLADILYVEGLKDYVKIYLADGGRPVTCLTSMRTVEAALPAPSFLRTHRSFIVNMDRVNVLERGQVVFGEKIIPVSDSYREAILQYVNDRMLQGRGG